MSKTKLALLVFCVTFLINGLAFLFSHKTFTVEENKSVWLYELPLSESPLDAYVALDLGPHQGVVGTLFRPNHDDTDHALQPLLADSYSWDNAKQILSIKLKANLKYGNGDPILPEHFVEAHDYLSQKLSAFSDQSIFGQLRNSIFKATPNGLTISFTKLPEDFDLEYFLTEALTHPLSGVIHPINLAELKAGKPVQKTWITSGPYLISKWTAKEIELISRTDFVGGMQKDVTRTLKYQSAPVKNPACDFLQGRIGDDRSFTDHNVLPSRSRATIFWICRSYEQTGFCKDPQNRKILSELFAGKQPPNPTLLAGKTLRYRIPVGSDAFRNAVREKIVEIMAASGGKSDETSYFFGSSKDTDIELEFVITPENENLDDTATNLAKLSSRFGSNAAQESNLVGVIETFPLQILMKSMKGEVYSKVFVEPDLDEKKLPL